MPLARTWNLHPLPVRKTALNRRPALEAISGQMRWQNLDRHIAVEPRVLGSIDLAHASCADGREDFVGTEFLSCLQRHESLSNSVPNRLIMGVRLLTASHAVNGT